MSFAEFAGSALAGLMRFAGALTGNRHLAEEVVQEVMIRVQKQWTRIESLDDPAGYVRRMIVNEYLSWRRKWSRIVPTRDLEDGRTAPDPAERHAERDELAARLNRLPRRQRAVIVLRFYLDQSDDQIAAALGCSTGTVRSHTSRALAALRIDDAPAPVAPAPIERTSHAHR